MTMNQEKYPNRLKAARKQASLTQQEVANRLGLTKQAYLMYEYGKRDMKVSMLAELAKIFGCSADWLVCFSTTDDSESYSLPAATYTSESHLVANYRALNDEGQEHLVEYSDNLTHVPKYKKGYQPGLAQEAG
jgi:transcriptional regulator with XRE-family HTH domain